MNGNESKVKAMDKDFEQAYRYSDTVDKNSKG